MPIRLQPVAAMLLLAAAAVPGHAQQIVVSKDNRTIAVTTSADATAEADTVTVEIGFVEYGADQDSAYAAGSKTSNAIAAALKASSTLPLSLTRWKQRLSPSSGWITGPPACRAVSMSTTAGSGS